MSKLTNEERTKIVDLWGDKSCDQMIDWVEKMKELWQEIAVAEYKLKKEMETKFYGSEVKRRIYCYRCGRVQMENESYYLRAGGYICMICRQLEGV